MSNELFLKNYQNIYESLQYFSINGNVLTLNYNGTYIMELNHINLINLNQNLFLLNPIEIYQIIYMLELLYKDEISNYEMNFASSYTNNYLNLNDTILSNNESNSNLAFKANIFAIPIYTAYDEAFNNKPAGTLIKNLLNTHVNKIESGEAKGQRLVRTNPNGSYFEEDNDFEYFKNAGFVSLIIIALGVVLTTSYIVLFILNN